MERGPKVAFISGAGSGIGRALALRLAREGYVVAATDMNREAADETLRGLGDGRHRAWRLDVTEEDAVSGVFGEVEEGLGPIYGLACCAGTLPDPSSRSQPPTADTSLTTWVATEAVNVRGSFLCVRQYLRARRRTPLPAGRIVLISSTAGQVGRPTLGPVYPTTKAAVLGLTRAVAAEVAAQNITVNAVAPGPCDTPAFRKAVPTHDIPSVEAAVPLRRLGQAEEVAAAISYLFSEDAAFVTGATLDVNGGSRMQ